MKALIFAAGRGERMRPLTDTTPKPLLKLNGKALIEYALENLATAGFSEVVINVAYLGQQIIEFCADGSRWGVAIEYSDEGSAALETAGGIVKALPMLGDQPFLAINSDVVCDYPLASLRDKSFDLAHLVMIANPPHHPQGDFSLDANGHLSEQGDSKLTFSGIGLYRPQMFAGLVAGQALKLRPLFNAGMREQRISGEHYRGAWRDIGTPQALLDQQASVASKTA